MSHGTAYSSRRICVDTGSPDGAKSETTNPRKPAGYAMGAATYMGFFLSAVTGSQPNQFDPRPSAV